MPGTGFTVHADFDNKWGGRYHDQEVANDEEWVDGSTRTSGFHLDKVYVEGPLWKTGQKVTLGNFQPWTQDGFVDDASLKGAMFEHYGSKFTTHVFGGHLDAKVWDMAMDAEMVEQSGFKEGWLESQSVEIKVPLMRLPAKENGFISRARAEPALTTTGRTTCAMSRLPSGRW